MKNSKINKRILVSVMVLTGMSGVMNAQLVLPDTEAIFDLDNATIYLFNYDDPWMQGRSIRKSPQKNVIHKEGYIDENGTYISDNIVYQINEGDEYMKDLAAIDVKFPPECNIGPIYPEQLYQPETPSPDVTQIHIYKLSENGDIIKEWAFRGFYDYFPAHQYIVWINEYGLYKLIIPQGLWGDFDYTNIFSDFGMKGHANRELGFYFRLGPDNGTHLNEICNESLNQGEMPVFDTMGRKVLDNATKADIDNLPVGIYIINGKKFINR